MEESTVIEIEGLPNDEGEYVADTCIKYSQPTLLNAQVLSNSIVHNDSFLHLQHCPTKEDAKFQFSPVHKLMWSESLLVEGDGIAFV